MSARTLLRIGAAIATGVGSVAGVIAANPALLGAALPPHAASVVTLVALGIVAALHETVHSSPALRAPSPADPASTSKDMS